MKNYNDMALALAGVCQSVLLISQLAQKGEVDNQDAFQNDHSFSSHYSTRRYISRIWR